MKISNYKNTTDLTSYLSGTVGNAASMQNKRFVIRCRI